MTTVKIVRKAQPAQQTATQPPVSQPAPVAQPQPEPIRVREVGGRNWKIAGLGLGGIVLGFAGFAYFMSHPTATILGVGAVMALIGGGIGIWQGVKKRESGIEVITASGKPVKDILKDANSVNIYGDKILFEKLPDTELKGSPRKCLNDNKYYFVNIWDTAFNNPRPEGKLVEFKLPDTQYRDPREFANNINIPAHRRLATRKASLFEKISPIFLIIAIVIIGIIWVATTPVAPTGG